MTLAKPYRFPLRGDDGAGATWHQCKTHWIHLDYDYAILVRHTIISISARAGKGWLLRCIIVVHPTSSEDALIGATPYCFQIWPERYSRESVLSEDQQKGTVKVGQLQLFAGSSPTVGGLPVMTSR